MAMPVAIGIEGRTSKPDKAPVTSGSTPPALSSSSKTTANTSIQKNVRAAEEANHLICCRSSPLVRRKRTNSEITPPSPATSNIGTARLQLYQVQHRRAPFRDLSREASGPHQRRASF